MLAHSASHRWFWDGDGHVDPAKEAKGQETRLNSMTTTLAAEYAKQGKDWLVELRQRAKELDEMKKLGLIAKTATLVEDKGDSDADERDD